MLQRKLAVRLEEAHSQPKWLRGLAAQKIHRGTVRLAVLVCQYAVIADFRTRVGAPGWVEMLDASQRGCIACRLQGMNDVLTEVRQLKATIRQAQHAGAVRGLPGEQGGAAGRAGGRGAIRPRKSVPCSASRCKFGVGMAWP